MSIANRIINAVIFGESQTNKKLKYAVHIPVSQESKSVEVPVLVEMIHPSGGKIMVPNTKINDIFALGLSVRRKL